ncbi:MAG TPA: PAS domain S-box protein [Candidatus Angelobacter sp.]|jgi:PAS domain S-box-containing protein|nr:PAS domain S-box protein [Candidatus Angelobacter sp.]
MAGVDRTLDSQLFPDVFNASPVGIVVEDLQGQPLFVNPAFCSFLGFTEEEMRGKHCVDFSPAEDAQRDWELFQQLRAGSIDHYQLEKRYFRSDGSLVWGNLTLSLLKTGPAPLVIAMVHDITEKKAAEELLTKQSAELQTSEELLRNFVKNVPAEVAMLDREMRYLQVSDRWCSDFGFDGLNIIGRSHYELFPDLPQRWKEVHRRVLAGETLRADEDQWERASGTRWFYWELRPWMTESGTVGGVLMFGIDVTQRKQMQEALAAMSRKLLEAQEQERARIGRELHDDITQRLVLLALELEQMQLSSGADRPRLEELRQRTMEISQDVQALSHELHSPRLEYLGVIPCMKSWCSEFAERQRIEVEFNNEVSSAVPPDIGLCLFRVLQEGIHNALKHSGVKHVAVHIEESGNEICLCIRDSGRGFDVEAARRGNGLGLASMEERVRLVHGKFAIESKPMGGTAISVHVPLSLESSLHRANGREIPDVNFPAEKEASSF